MGQIIGTNAKVKRCNLNAIQAGGSQYNTILADGEYMLVSSDNSMTTTGNGNFDSYILGDGTTPCGSLTIMSIVATDEAPTEGSTNAVQSGIMYNILNIKALDSTNTNWINGFYIGTSHIIASANTMSMCHIINNGYTKINAHVRNTATTSYAVAMFSSPDLGTNNFVTGQKFGGSNWDTISLDIPSNVTDIYIGTRNEYLEDSSFSLYIYNTEIVDDIYIKTINNTKIISDDITSTSISITTDNSNATSDNYTDYIRNGQHRGIYLIDALTYKDYTITIDPSGSALKAAIQLRLDTSWSTNIYDSGWKTASFSITKETASEARYIAIVCANASNTEVSYNDFISAVTFSVTGYESKAGLLERMNSAENAIGNLSVPESDKIRSISTYFSLSRSDLNTNTYYGEKIAPTYKYYTYSSEVIGNLTMTTNLQGAAIWNNYLFQFDTNLNHCEVYDLETKQSIQLITLTPITNFHAGSGGFSSIFYDSNDPFPLLYISSMSAAKTIGVFRITGSIGNLTITRIQTITLSVDFYLPNITIDRYTNQVIVFGYLQNSYSVSTNNASVFCCFEIPDASISAVTITDVKYKTYAPFIYAQQGAYAEMGRLYLSYGVSSNSYGAGLIIYDYYNRNIVNIVGFNDTELGQIEPEGLGVYNKKLYMTCNPNARVVEIEFQ